LPVRDVFILETTNLEQNNFTKFPLHFVDNQTQKLQHKYSILVKQYVVSESTYQFWKTIKANNFEAGGLFDSQPVAVKGNVTNINDESEVVLGNFTVASISEKRIIIENVPLSFDDVPGCNPVALQEPLSRLPRSDWPIYLVYFEDYDGVIKLGILQKICVDCTLLGGKTIKPEFW
jgi:hypothetical protein